MRKKLLFIVNVDWFFVSHRLPIAIEALKQGYEVHIATAVTDKLSLLEGSGLTVHSLSLHRSRSGFIKVVTEFLEILSLFHKISPDIVHLVTIKPVLFGGIAARLMKVPSVVSAISGLGFVFVKTNFFGWFRRKIISFLYRLALTHPNQKIIFQNADDQSQICKLANLPVGRTVLIHGSGVNLSLYNMQKLPVGVPIVLLAARLLRDKGVSEFVGAAKLVNSSGIRANFVLVGEVDPSNPESIEQSEIDSWKIDGEVEIWGYRDDMDQVLSLATIVVLPSYREGFPKVLIEAAACGRAVVTTDVPGCRDAIEDGITGLLVPVHDAKAIADAVLELLNNPQYCEQLGKSGRERAERVFDLRLIVAKHISIYEKLISTSNNQ